ncbi:MAG: hypothetical protein ABNH53_05480 [Henriciella sp.]|jgi:hypothetical protein
MKRREKKSESLDIRLPYEQKREFMDATRKQGETASEALRRFIAAYTEEARLTETSNPVQEIRMTLARHRLKTLASATGAAIGVFVISALPSAADSTAFDHLDKNKDGFITVGEILPGEDSDIIAQLDTDGSGGVSREELKAAGNKIIVKSVQSGDVGDGQEVVRRNVKVIEFVEKKGADTDIMIGTNFEKRLIVERTGDADLSEEELEALIETLSETGIDGEITFQPEYEIELNMEANPKKK